MKSLLIQLFCFYGIGVLLFLPACKTVSVINFQVLEAPPIILPTDISYLTFVDRNVIHPSDSLNQYYKIDGQIRKDLYDFTSKMSLNCYEGFRENLSEFFHPDSMSFLVLPEEKQVDTLTDMAPLSWFTVDSICRVAGSDVLVLLDYIRVFVEHELIEADTYWAFTDMSYVGKLSVYDPLNKEIYSDKVISDSLFLESESESELRLIYQVIPEREQLLNDAAYELGRNYVRCISPQWSEVSRWYFIGGDERFSRAQYFVEKDDFETAIGIWKELVDEENLLISARAAFNIAVAKEATDKLEGARNWINKSINYYKHLKNKSAEYKKIKAYSLVLNSRWINGKKIKRFFGEED